jgi:hypothetical protein
MEWIFRTLSPTICPRVVTAADSLIRGDLDLTDETSMKTHPDFLTRQFPATFFDVAFIDSTIARCTGTIAVTSSVTFRTHLEVIS